MANHFRAPWGTKLKLMTGLFLLLVFLLSREASPSGTLALVGLTLGCAALAIRGYSIVEGQLLIHRLGWASRFDLSTLQAAEIAPYATVGSIRTFGIGGVFGFIGHFRSPVLGSYRAYATDAANAVVLDFGAKKLVVTPDSPAEFIAALHSPRLA
jgi:hypothetical protein